MMLRRHSLFILLLAVISLYLASCRTTLFPVAPSPELLTATQALAAAPTATFTAFAPVFPTAASSSFPTAASPLATLTPIPTQTPTSAILPPPAPAGVTAIAVSAFQIDLAWMDHASDETDFVVERCIGLACSSFSLLMSLPAGAQAYSDHTAQPLTDYCYRVFATSAAGRSGYSDTACIATPAEIVVEMPPTLPQLNAPANATTGIPLLPSLSVTVSDANQESVDVTFYGRPYEAEGEDFTLIVLPDTQYYSSFYPATFYAQTQWIVDNQASQNILFVTHLGDIVDSGDGTSADTEWVNASNAIALLETNSANLPYGIPYGLAVGNHDQAVAGDPDSPTNHYNTYFGITHFTGRPYYGGYFGSDNDNHYELFNSGGLKFIIIHIECALDENNSTFRNATAWADELLATTYKNRRGIIVFHNLFSLSDKAEFSTPGKYLFNQLKDNANLFLMLGGHVLSGVSRRSDTGTNGNTIHSLLTNFQTETNGGDGWLRSLRFSTGDNRIYVTTYSPTLNQTRPESDTENTFSLDYDMSRGDFKMIGEVNSAPSGGAVSLTWFGLLPDTRYEWYCVASDGQQQTNSPIWLFTTGLPEAVNSVYVNAVGQANAIQLYWQTVQEIDLLGFNLYRAEALEGVHIQLNSGLVLPLPAGQMPGNLYQFTDTTAEPGRLYYYWVEWVGLLDRSLSQPVSAARLIYSSLWLPIILK